MHQDGMWNILLDGIFAYRRRPYLTIMDFRERFFFKVGIDRAPCVPGLRPEVARAESPGHSQGSARALSRLIIVVSAGA
jgi:hypothetical protein